MKAVHYEAAAARRGPSCSTRCSSAWTAPLSGIGIHQLITGGDGDEDNAVTTARFTWNGHKLTAADQLG